MTRARLITFNLTSVDGRLTLSPGYDLMAPDERWKAVIAQLGDPYLWVRDALDPQLLLEGSGSFLSPEETALVAEATDSEVETDYFLPAAVVDVPGRRWFAVVDGAGAVDLQFTEWPDPAWTGWHALVLTSRAAPESHLERLRNRGIPYLVVGQEHVWLGRALELVHELLGVRTVVCAGGGRLGGALLRQGLVDEIHIEVLPWAIGGRGTPTLFDCAPLGPDEWPTRLELIGHEVLPAGHVRLRYIVVRPTA
ncbi:MAG TPA: dihydrofolate reductase family protein [Actinomycetota bacterium]|nr:dihydrofolate reductase family protein [Actinomycetota bacterium]